MCYCSSKKKMWIFCFNTLTSRDESLAYIAIYWPGMLTTAFSVSVSLSHRVLVYPFLLTTLSGERVEEAASVIEDDTLIFAALQSTQEIKTSRLVSCSQTQPPLHCSALTSIYTANVNSERAEWWRGDYNEDEERANISTGSSSALLQ